jgi:D-alanyl-D-alanine endopeptidase (penicillin-binding protein 7)
MKLPNKLAFFIITIGLSIPSFSYSAEFNPNYLISDEEMQNYQCMDKTDIQAFLDDNGGYISRLRTEDKNGDRKTTADIISQAAKEYSINPKYLLVKLQKEQSLITDPDPTQKQLDGATGYGITDGCGWTCDSYLRNKGFGKQVDSAAGIMRWYYDHVGEESWIKKPNTTYNIDSTSVKPVNYATAFLYTYTPHLQGNQNFWTLWQRWFDQVYPDGSLVKTADNSSVYLIQDGKKRLIESMSALVTRYNPKLIIIIPSSEIARYETGSAISLPNYAVLKQNEKYYLVDYDYLRPFSSQDVVRALGYNPDEIIDVTAEDVADYKIGLTITADVAAPFGRLVRVKEDDQLYYLQDNVYSPIFDDQIAKINFPNLAEEKINATDLANYTLGDPTPLKDGILFGVTGSNRIYVTEKGEKRHIASEEVYTGMGYKWENIIWLNQFAGMAHENGQAIYLRQAVAVANSDPTEESATTNEKMIRTPADQTKYVGKIFETNIDAYLIADFETKEILAGKNIDVIRPMASLTKAMTAYRLMTEELNLKRITTYESAKHRSQYNYFRIAEGEQVRNRDLMDALLVSSLNTPARMLVSSLTSDESAFVKRMNAEAKNWGLTNTKFADVSGESLENKTTAKEYLSLFKNSLGDSMVAEYLAKKDYQYSEVLDKDGKPDHYDENSNELVNKANLGFNIIASKTGYLDEAGSNLAMLVSRPSDGKKFIVITLGNADYAHRFDEPEALANWTIKNF